MHLKDVGIDYGAVKALLSFGSVILASAKFLTGFLYDRFGLRVTATFCNLMAIISVFCLAFIQNDALGFALAVTYTVISQFSMPLETIMLPLYASDLFGHRSYVSALGIFVSMNTAGYAVGAPLMNLCYDLTGSYVPALIAVGSVMCAVLILLQVVITLSHREQKRIAAAAEVQ
jgi:predicted MFS family arabinose efflux permease